MKKGRLNPDLLFFLKLHRRHAFLAKLQQVRDLVSGAADER